MKKSQRADHAVVGFRMTRTANEDSPGIYINWEIHRDQEHSSEEKKKKRSDPKISKISSQTTVSLLSKIATEF